MDSNDTEVTMSENVQPSTEGASDGVELTSKTEPESSIDEGSEGQAEAAKPAYTPNYKLKVYHEEKDLDDPFLKALIKDEDSEKKVKEIAQKYLGFDTLKGISEKTKVEFENYRQQLEPIADVYNNFQSLYKKGDLEGIFDLLKISEQDIYKYAIQKAEQSQLPVEQQQAIAYQRQVARDREMLQNQNQSLQQMQYQQQSNFKRQELSWTMQRPDVKQVADSFDQRVGQPEAFKQMVVEKGLAHYAATGQDLAVEDAVQAVIKMLGASVSPQTNAMGQPNPGLIRPNEAPPIIPSVAGKGSSPVKKQIRTIEDLKRRSEQLRT